ncbi:hypothetical protein Q5741_00150 [Paenibacillus sp. JX-17]|uniref:Bacterial bifunctional deaminase-reductase C-terminal domain-containing protein n=1 Tax=Paenibacillus lacisoli TaxID=3064525 RepID=A0ABT9C6D0_9BACL|nr:hypothetical protein [Paenibacillus sp. JX-17]MDO7904818.1 hypothetical protein [Paenibacillus sp. JX-17]
MEKPYIICHMVTSLDGKIIGDYLKVERAAYFTEEYEEIHGRYESKAWMCGRVTMEEHFTFGHKYKKIGISYIFGGKERLNFRLVVGKLKKLLKIDNLMLEG